MTDISDLLCMHKDIDLLKHEISIDFSLPYEDTKPLKECQKCAGYNSLCGLYYAIHSTKIIQRKNKHE